MKDRKEKVSQPEEFIQAKRPDKNLQEKILSQGWREVNPGNYIGFHENVTYKDRILYVRETKLEDFLTKIPSKAEKIENPNSFEIGKKSENLYWLGKTKKSSKNEECGEYSSKGVSANPVKSRLPGRGQKPLWVPKGTSDPVAVEKPGSGFLPELSHFGEFKTLELMRKFSHDSIVIGFDTEWDSRVDQIISYQFACIKDDTLVEFVFITSGKPLSLDYCLGRILDFLDLPKAQALDLRNYMKYSYCDTLTESGDVLVKDSSSRKDALEKSKYLYFRGRSGNHTKHGFYPVDHDGLGAFVRDHSLEYIDGREWSLIHPHYDLSDADRIPVTVVCHTGKVDFRNFQEAKDKEHSIFRYLSEVQGGLVTLKYPMSRNCKTTNHGQSHTEKAYPVTLDVRDTMAHAPAGKKSLETLGDIVHVPKIKLCNTDGLTEEEAEAEEKKIKSHMMDLWNENPGLFLNYASRDSVVTMLYAASLYGYNKSIPVTATAAGARVAQVLILNYFGGCPMGWKKNDFFNEKFRGLRREDRGMIPRTDKPGFIENSSLEPLSNKAHDVQYFSTQAYHGGYNGSSRIGLFDGITTYDYDLRNAYPTALSIIPDVDWSDPISQTVENKDLTLDDFRISQYDPRPNPIPLFVCYCTFEFPATVKYPCIPVTIDGSPVFLRTSKGLNGVYTMGPEIVLALRLGAKIHCERGFFIKPLVRKDGKLSQSLSEVCRMLVADRSLAKAKYHKGCLEELILKTIVCAIYGKTGQNVIDKTTWSAYTREMEDIGASCISNPVVAAMTTSIVRAELLAVQNQAEAAEYHAYSVTTDGGIFDCPEDVMKSFDLYGLRDVMMQSRLFLTDNKDPEIWEIKHAQDDLLNFTRRGNVSLYWIDSDGNGEPFQAPNGKSYPGVCAHNGVKSGFDSDGPKDREWLYKAVGSRVEPVKFTCDEWTSFKDMSLGKDFEVKPVTRHVRMDFDFSRKPIKDSFCPVYAKINGETYEIANFDTEAYEDKAEFLEYRKRNKNRKNLRTMAEWDRFWTLKDLREKGCRATAKDMPRQIIMSIVMGYRSGKFKIPGLDLCETVDDKLAFINQHNDSKKPFTRNDWKNCRKPERQSNMLPDEYLTDKLEEMGAKR